MRKSLSIGVVAAFILAAGVTVAWVGIPEGRLAVAPPSAVAQTTDVDQAITDSGQAAIKAAIASVGPAVVRVDVTGTVSISNPFSDFFDDPFFRRFFEFDTDPQERETESVGSGVVFEHAGEKLVLTNAHVVDNADTIKLTDPSGNTWTANVIGSDELLDVAVLRVTGDTGPLFAATLGDSDTTEIGDWAIAIGNPLGLSYTVTLGIISATDRDIAKPNGVGTYSNLIQTDAAINPGNSGGPLVNASGEVIGINTLIARGTATGISIEGINFAIAINGIADILEQLVETGIVSRGWLGVQVSDVTPATAESFGVDPERTGALIAHTYPGDPADVAGIEIGDIVVRIGDTAIESSDDLVSEIARLGAGTQVEFELVRGDETIIVDVLLDERPAEDVLAFYEGSAPPDQPESASAFGMTVGPITAIVAQHLGLNSTDGVVIMDVAASSRAELAGLGEGDIIVEVDHEPIVSVEDWNEAVSELDEGTQVVLTVLRDGRLGFVRL
jgi:serine protease Do